MAPEEVEVEQRLSPAPTPAVGIQGARADVACPLLVHGRQLEVVPRKADDGADRLTASLVPSETSWLDEDQVVTCAKLLLYGVLGEEAFERVWITHCSYVQSDLQIYRMQGQEPGSELEKLQQWLSSTPEVVAYVVTQVWNGHWICLAVDTPSPDRCEVTLYDSQHKMHNIVDDMVVEKLRCIAQQIFELKFPERRFPRCRHQVLEVPIEEQQDSRAANCGFHVALFIAKDVQRRISRPKQEASEEDLQLRLTLPRNWPPSAQALRRWTQIHADRFTPRGSSNAGPHGFTCELSDDECKAAFQQLQDFIDEATTAWREVALRVEPAPAQMLAVEDLARCYCPWSKTWFALVALLVLFLILLLGFFKTFT